MTQAPTEAPPLAPPTVSHILGEMVWLLTQSPLHRALAIGDIEWLIMPALLHRQFYVFRDAERPVGLALWAKCNAAAEAKLERGMLEPENRLAPDEWVAGDRIWLVDLIAPFADASNRHREIMLADLIAGPLKDQAFSFHVTDPVTGVRSSQRVAADASARLKQAIDEAIAKR